MPKRLENDPLDFAQTKFPKFLQSYQQVFNQVIGTDGLEIEMKDKRFVPRRELDLLNFHPVYDPPTTFFSQLKC